MAAKNRPEVMAIYNARAGKHTDRAGIGQVLAHLAATPRWTFGTETLDELANLAEHAHAIRPEIVVSIGGDGTLKAIIDAICRKYETTPAVPLPMIWIIPAGTENVTASALGLTGSKDRLIAHVKTIREKIDAGVPLDSAHLHALKANDGYGMLYGAGSPVHILRAVYAHSALGPRKRILKAVSQAFWPELGALVTFRKSPQTLTRPVHARITLPPGSDPPVAPLMTHTAILAGTIDQIGMGFRGLPDARSYPGNLMLRSTDLGFWGLLRASGHLLAGLPHPAIFDTVVPYVDIEYAEPTDITVDGEIYTGRTHDRLACGPLLTFITG